MRALSKVMFREILFQFPWIRQSSFNIHENVTYRPRSRYFFLPQMKSGNTYPLYIDMNVYYFKKSTLMMKLMRYFYSKCEVVS